MNDGDAIASFWSYAREDNKSDRGRILQLAEDIAQEFNLIAGDSLEVFVDSESVEWGEQWRARIDGSLSDASFLIAIITPRYFKRVECRKELLAFHGQAKSQRLEKLLLPILYIDVPDLSEDSKDEVMAIVARTQFADWRVLRLRATDSAEYRFAVNGLAQRILNLAQEAASVLVATESMPRDEEPGVSETVDEINEISDAWLESVMEDKVNSAQLIATVEQYKERLIKLRERRTSKPQVLASHLRHGLDVMPMVEKRFRDSQVYLARSAELDPLVLRLIRQLEDYPPGVDLAIGFLYSVQDAVDNIASTYRTGFNLSYLRGFVGLSMHLKRASRLADDSDALIVQGNSIVARWWNGGVGRLLQGPDFVRLEEMEGGRWTLALGADSVFDKTVDFDPPSGRDSVL